MEEKKQNKKTEFNSASKTKKSTSADIIDKIQGSNNQHINSSNAKTSNTINSSIHEKVEMKNNASNDGARTVSSQSDSRKRMVTQENKNTLEAEREFREKINKRPGERNDRETSNARNNSGYEPVTNKITEQSYAYSKSSGPSVTPGYQSKNIVRKQQPTRMVAKKESSNILGYKQSQSRQYAKDYSSSNNNRTQYNSGDNIASISHSGRGGGLIPRNTKIPEIMGAGEVRLSANKRVRIAGTVSSFGKLAKSTAVMAASVPISQTDAGRGLRMTTTAARVTSSAAVYIVRKRLNAPLRAEMVLKYGTSDPKILLSHVNRVLRSNGYKTLSGTGSALENVASRNLRKLYFSKKAAAPPAVIQAYKEAKNIGRLTTFSNNRMGQHPLKLISSESFRFVIRKLSETEAGQGLRVTTTVASRSIAISRRMVMLARNTAHLAIVASRAATLHSIKVLTKRAKSAAKAAAKTTDVVKAANLNNKASKLASKAAKKSRRIGKANSAVNKLSRIADTIRDPFGIRRWRAQKKLKKKLARRRFLRKHVPGFKQIDKLRRMISKIFAKVANVLHGLKVTLLAVLGGLVLLIILVNLANTMLMTLLGKFDINSDSRKKVAIKTLEKCYMDDLEKMANLDYESIEIIYEDIRDDDEYTKRKKDTNAKAFYQSSNCAEILSMAYVWSDYDFKNVKKSKLKDYVKGLWYGSHDIIVQEHVIIEKDEDGNDVERKTATVTYRTYYFNSLFACKSRSAPSPIEYIDDNEDVSGCADSWDQIYVWLRNNKFSYIETCAIMGNLAYETGNCANNGNVSTITKSTFMAHPPDPTADASDGYGIFQWIGGRRINRKAYITSFGGDLYTAQNQLKAFKNEIKTDFYEKQQYSLVKACSSAQDAGYSFACNVERCGTQYRQGRGLMADKISKWYSEYENDWETLIDEGQQIADYAKTFVGKLHYAGDGSSWRGYSLSTKNGGTDCSGFVSLIYKSCLPKAKQSNFIGTAASYYDGYYEKYKTTEPKPGDVVVTASKNHTGIYVGGGKYVNMSWYNCGKCTEKSGPCANDCKLSDVPSGAYYIRIWEKFK